MFQANGPKFGMIAVHPNSYKSLYFNSISGFWRNWKIFLQERSFCRFLKGFDEKHKKAKNQVSVVAVASGDGSLLFWRFYFFFNLCYSHIFKNLDFHPPVQSAIIIVVIWL